jgi:Lon protease-like protein
MPPSKRRADPAEEWEREGVVPVFPLPGVVFFPRTSLPLHVFEPRYRAMVRDVVAGPGLMAVSLLRPGWEADYEGSPAFHDVGTLGHVEDLQPMPDGRFYLRLVGLARVRFGEIVSEAPYRSARYTVIPETGPDEGDPAIRSGKIGLLTTHGCLLRELSDRDVGGWVFDESVALPDAVNGAAAGLPVDPAVRQSLLEENDLARRMERASHLLDEVLEHVLRLKALRGGGNGDGGVN